MHAATFKLSSLHFTISIEFDRYGAESAGCHHNLRYGQACGEHSSRFVCRGRPVQWRAHLVCGLAFAKARDSVWTTPYDQHQRRHLRSSDPLKALPIEMIVDSVANVASKLLPSLHEKDMPKALAMREGLAKNVYPCQFWRLEWWTYYEALFKWTNVFVGKHFKVFGKR